jgi:hypothetical protein
MAGADLGRQARGGTRVAKEEAWRLAVPVDGDYEAIGAAARRARELCRMCY